MNTIRETLQDVNVGPVERGASVLAGAAALFYALTRRGRSRWVSFLGGSGLLLRGVTGHSFLYQRLGMRTAGQARDSKHGIKVSELVTINRTPEELYGFWRRLENLPRIMRHLESVHVIDEGRSRWRIRGPAGAAIEWDAEIVRDFPGRLITWQSLPYTSVIHAGSVSFDRVPGGAGTELRVILRYDPPGGALGAALAELLGEDPGRRIREDLLNFKRMVESEEILAAGGRS
jgi:uncharacterized membrane protein